ncbi:protein kinase domain-containing protein [Urbifossiella limnaea]|uniref:Serine/threonine-protein kinase PknB n=1 Tax=Urbifossiella limnaea TaxID=2528023 RepID=A0A517Y302_9BACT|nr:protein kinase [Urbifossiella limnaea]QDU24092.1 Serine/threonine-protein kinase PknB [Urbifossiella limnaea]
MTITCTRCRRTLSTADPGGPPAFCMYCGQKLSAGPADPNTPVPAGMVTGSFVPFSDTGEPAPEPPPAVVGGYHLRRFLGAGGMGTVYEAEAPDTGARVAVKLLSGRLAANPGSVDRFRQEGRLASQLAHPRCVFVLAADTDAGRPYIVMELMPGRTLKDVVDERGPVPPDQAVAHILDVVEGLAEAHRLGVLHRDVKPSNCFLAADGRVKVGDFGLSKSLVGSSDRQLTQSGAFLGTVLFASPEQLRGDPLDYGSDVYSVCATLYYLLCGEAPYHHESITAALAKAVTEPAVSIRDRCPAVSAALDRVVMKGLERDPGRRWGSLEELREALIDLVPARQTPARPRALIGAFLLDAILLTLLVTLPVEILRKLIGWGHVALAGVPIDPVEDAVTLAYFATLEGLFGRTLGKALLGLRVSRVGATGPPGLGRAWLRAGTFGAMMLALMYAPAAAGQVLGGWVGLAVLAAGLAVFAVQLRRSPGGYRGVHDLVSGCHVTQRPFRSRRPKLVSARPNPLDALVPPDPSQPLPATLGGYAVRGRLWADGAGGEVWAAEDRALGRRVVIWLTPTAVVGTDPARPTRLRRLGSGRVAWAGADCAWTAFAAPVGAPLADTIHPRRPLPWADARFLLEQLVDEFRAAAADGTTPPRLGLDQVWVEPNGRVQLLDFPGGPVTAAAGGAPFALLRAVAGLTLEGRPRDADAGGVRAPVPPHAVPVLDRLFDPRGYRALDAVHADLAATHAHPPEVTPSIRAAQLTLQAAVLAGGLLLMFVSAAAVGVVVTALAGLQADISDRTLAALRDPAQAPHLGRIDGAAKALNDPRAAGRVERLRDRKRDEAGARRAELLGVQRKALDRIEDVVLDLSRQPAEEAREMGVVLAWAAAPEKAGRGDVTSPWGSEAGPVWVLLAAVPLVWVLTAGLLRGGVSMLLTGIAVVRADGRRASRRQCAWRALLVWLPVAGLLTASAWVQVYHPARSGAAVALWLLAAALLPVYVAVALKFPTRPPQDRLAGTYLVPA